MNTDESPTHFAWDLLDSAKQVAEPRSAETQAAEKPAATEPGPQSQVPDIRPESQPVRPVACALDDAPIGQHEPPETLIVRLEQATAEGGPPHHFSRSQQRTVCRSAQTRPIRKPRGHRQADNLPQRRSS
jgi:hypothetical protein